VPQFIHHDLRLLNPAFSSPLLDVLTELEYLRRLEIRGTTPLPVFVQLKQVFHYLESLASARIEGNHTTLADLVESKVAPASAQPSETLQEIENIERAMVHVEESVQPGQPISEHLIRSLHAMTVNGLVREGDRTPGAYRSGPIAIAQADHLPPEALHVPSYMQALVEFVNCADAPKYDLMKVALAHHRFAWIHPFGNGNGRVVRLLTYAMLIKYGFRVSDVGRLLNPAAVFCANRQAYYDHLSQADAGTDMALEQWCHYVLLGVLDELRKVESLANYQYLKAQVLVPAIAHARERQHITAQEAAVLRLAVEVQVAKAADLEPSMPGLNAAQRTYQIKKLVDSGMLVPLKEGSRQYTIGFSHNMLLRGVVQALRSGGFIPEALSG
jgi:Fic family protein